MIQGRVWRFGDDLDTDVMFPGRAMKLTTDEATRLLFDAVRPGWPQLVSPGDVIIAGRNFGMGSARPVGVLLRRLGIAAVVSESMSSLFQRNCVNAGLLAVAAPGVLGVADEGDLVEIAEETGEIVGTSTRRSCRFRPLPDLALRTIALGGIINQLRHDGYLPSQQIRAASLEQA